MLRLLITVYLLLPLALGHPQCNDFTPPLEKPTRPMYCNVYQEHTCCTAKMDQEVEDSIKDITSDLNKKGLSGCIPMLKEYACQECSPYAAHVFETEEFGTKRVMPGLCSGFCSNFYRKCKEAMKLFTKDPDILDALSSETNFCSLARLNDKTYCYPDILDNTDLNAELDRPTSSVEGCVCFQEISSGLRNPMFLVSSDNKDDSGLMYVGLQKGLVYLCNTAKKIKSVFIDISKKFFMSVRRGDERGLLGMTFHPNFKQTRKFYLFYVASAFFGRDERIKIAEYRTRSGNLHEGDIDSERIILEVAKSFPIHNGGALLFGDDGYLYVTLGDGGLNELSQDTDKLMGSILRLDVSKSTKYEIPPSNPFVGKPGRDEIYAYGFRNPYRASIDRGDPRTGTGRGRIFIGDVGQSNYEEINLLKKGGNYGWKQMEGQKCWDPPCKNMEPPIGVYDHGVGQAVIGGFIYRGCENPAFNGMYIYADYSSQRMFRLKETRRNGRPFWERKQVDICGNDLCKGGLNNNYPILVMSIGEDFNGELYFLTSSTASSGDPSGKILKIIDPRRNFNPASCRSRGGVIDTTRRTTASPPTTRGRTDPPPTTRVRTDPPVTSDESKTRVAVEIHSVK